MNVDTTSGDGIVSEIKKEVIRRRDERDAERKRLEALIERHRASIAKLGHVGTGAVLQATGKLLAERINEKHGTALVHEASGPFGLGPEWFLSLRDADNECWGILRIVGGPETMNIMTGDVIRRRTPFPDDLSSLVEIFEAQRREESAWKKKGKK